MCPIKLPGKKIHEAAYQKQQENLYANTVGFFLRISVLKKKCNLKQADHHPLQRMDQPTEAF